MPPKRKGKAASPIVVGTVSTRSTRRQSVVNIEIPKSKSKSRKGKEFAQEFQKYETEHEYCGKLREQIKASYNKVIGSIDKRDSLSQKNVANSKNMFKTSSSLSISKDNKELLQILEDWSDDESQENKEGSSKTGYKKVREFENLEFGADDIKKECSFDENEFNVTLDNETTLKEIERTLSSDNEELIYLEVSKSKVSERPLFSTSKLADLLPKEPSKIGNQFTEDSNSASEDVQLLEDANDLKLSEVESSTSSPQENQYRIQDEMEVTEEIAEEIVSPPTDEMLIEHSLQMKTITLGSTPVAEIIVASHEAISTTDDIVLCNTDSDSNNQIELITVAANNEETTQSISTSDSNDSEVRNYFAKEIERNESVHRVEEEVIEHIEEELTKSSVNDDQFIESPANSSEKQFVVPVTIEESKHAEDMRMKSEYVDTTTFEYEEVDSTMVIDDIENEMCEDNVSYQSKDMMDTSEFTEIEASFDDSNKTVEQKNLQEEIYKRNAHVLQDLKAKWHESKESQESLSQKIAELNLEMPVQKGKKGNKKGVEKEDVVNQSIQKDSILKKNSKTPKKKSDIFETDTVQESIDKELTKDEVISKAKKIQKKEKHPIPQQQTSNKANQKTRSKNDPKPGKVDIIPVSKALDILTVDSSRRIVKTPIQKSARDKKTKNIEVKAADKKSTSILLSKMKIKLSPIRKKGKDSIMKMDQPEIKKGKETTTKIETKKTKEVVRRTETEDYKHIKDSMKKFEQLDTPAKEISEKSESESKSENEGEDVEVRRSSRIKSISVLKKKTTGHGLVRSKSEMSLNESDFSDCSSILTEFEKTTPLGTPSASPKTTPRERKTRWSKSVDNLVGDLQLNSEITSHQGVLKMDVDEKPKLAAKDDPVVQARLKQFIHLKENVYKTSRMTCKEAKKMTCDCFLTEEEVQSNEFGCGEDCLNRLLLIEW